MAVYAISDCHFGHTNILRHREQFSTIEEHDEFIKDNILSVAGKRDSLYILGDVCLYMDAWHHVQEIADRVEYLHICLGNHCVSDDTEVLCEDGWKPASRITMTDRIASVDLFTNEMVFSLPKNVWSVGFQKMISLSSDKIDELVTSTHRVVYKNYLVPITTIPEKTYVKDFKNSAIVDRVGIDLSDDWIRLLTWVVCDGCLVQDKVYETKKRIQFKLSKTRKIESLTELLERMEIPFTLKECKKTGINKLQPYYIRIYGDYARDIFSKLGNVKSFPSYFRNINEHQFDVLCEELSITDGNRSCNIVSLSTTSISDAELLQFCAITNGYDCHIKTTDASSSGFSNGKKQYCLYITNDSSKSTKNVIKKEELLEQPSTAISSEKGTIVTRRNGKVSITGNCNERKGSPRLEDYMSIRKSVFAMKAYKKAWLTHAPIHPDELRGKINVHGHTHSNSIDDERYINVSCEAVDYRPINLAGIIKR